MRPRPEKKYKEPRTPKRRRVSDIVYLMTILTAFETIGIAMLVFPRSTESITEKRELKKFPELSAESSGNFFSSRFSVMLSVLRGNTSIAIPMVSKAVSIVMR